MLLYVSGRNSEHNNKYKMQMCFSFELWALGISKKAVIVKLARILMYTIKIHVLFFPCLWWVIFWVTLWMHRIGKDMPPAYSFFIDVRIFFVKLCKLTLISYDTLFKKPTVILHELCWCICNRGDSGILDGGDCDIKTSHDGLFERIFSVCMFL